MTPFEIDVLLHYYTRPTDHEVLQRNPPIWTETRTRFVADGLLEVSSNRCTAFKITDRGRAYVEALQRVPLPIQKWVQPEADAQGSERHDG
jgi:hypothetical protein